MTTLFRRTPPTLLTYAISSFIITIGMVINIYLQKRQFYPTFAYIAKSKTCNLVLNSIIASSHI
jgi:hypothetical protein